MARSCGVIAKGQHGTTWVNTPTGVAAEEPVGPEASWHIGQITRTMTASLFAIICENSHFRSRLNFDTTLVQVIRSARGTPYEGLTMAQLLTDHSGIPTSTGNITMFDGQRLSMKNKRSRFTDFILTSLPPGGPPGEVSRGYSCNPY